MGVDEVAVPPGARLGGSPLGGVVHVDEAEPRAIALGPLEVIEQRPGEIAADVDSPGDDVRDRADVSLEVLRPYRVEDRAVDDGVVETGPVLGDLQGQRGVLGAHAEQHVRQRLVPV